MKTITFTLVGIFCFLFCVDAQTWGEQIQKNDFAGFVKIGNAVYTVGVDKKSAAPDLIITTYKTTDDFQSVSILGSVKVTPNAQSGFNNGDVAPVYKRLALQIAEASGRIFLGISYGGRRTYNGVRSKSVENFGNELFVTTDNGSNWESVPFTNGSFSVPFQIAYGSASKATMGANAVKRYFLVKHNNQGYVSLDGKSFAKVPE